MGELIFRISGAILVAVMVLLINKFYGGWISILNGGWEYAFAVILGFLFFFYGKSLFEWLVNIWNYS